MRVRGQDGTATTKRLPGGSPEPQAPQGPAPRRRGLLPVKLGLLGVAALLLVAVLALLGLVAAVQGLRDGFRNPFAAQTHDRSQPAVLEAIEDLSVYKAATGNFQILVDIEKDVPGIPAAISGERTLFVAVGTVDAEVDFSTVTGEAIEVSEDGESVTVTLPRPTLSKAHVDPERSQVASRERGLLDRLGGVFSDNPTSERQLYIAAEQKMQQAAAESDLIARAEANTRATLHGMLTSLGFSKVEVRFVDPPVKH